jgi:hypothetical protein
VARCPVAAIIVVIAPIVGRAFTDAVVTTAVDAIAIDLTPCTGRSTGAGKDLNPVIVLVPGINTGAAAALVSGRAPDTDFAAAAVRRTGAATALSIVRACLVPVIKAGACTVLAHAGAADVAGALAFDDAEIADRRAGHFAIAIAANAVEAQPVTAITIRSADPAGVLPRAGTAATSTIFDGIVLAAASYANIIRAFVIVIALLVARAWDAIGIDVELAAVTDAHALNAGILAQTVLIAVAGGAVFDRRIGAFTAQRVADILGARDLIITFGV